MAVLEVTGVSKTFGSGELAVQALKPATFSVERGELIALLGPSGSGKSTLLLSISLILEPSAGRIVMNGVTVYDNGWTGVDVRAFRRRNIGFSSSSTTDPVPHRAGERRAMMAERLFRTLKRRAREVLGTWRSATALVHCRRRCPAASSSGSRLRARWPTSRR
jgi:putative ABC transport system ATP-binding protein